MLTGGQIADCTAGELLLEQRPQDGRQLPNSKREHERPASTLAPYEVGLREAFKPNYSALPKHMEEPLRRLVHSEEAKSKTPRP